MWRLAEPDKDTKLSRIGVILESHSPSCYDSCLCLIQCILTFRSEMSAYSKS